MGNIKFHRISFDITFRCTLKCKLCCSYAPYLKNPPHYSSDFLCKNISKFFAIVDKVDIFTIGGGEPFLHDELDIILMYVNKFRNRIGRLEIITNGTILPKTSVLNAIYQANAQVLLDDYGPKLSRKADVIANTFDKYKIKYTRRYNSDTPNGAYCNGWVNLIPTRLKKNEQDAAKLFSKCVQANELRCHPVIGGKIYVCPNYEFCVRLGAIPEDSRYVLDLTENCSIEEHKRKAKEFLAINYLPSCSFCNGFCLDSNRYVPAQQLTNEEVKEFHGDLSLIYDKFR